MKVKIISISREESRLRVRFEAGNGMGIADWAGGWTPVEGQEVDVEIDINDSISFGRTAQITNEHIFGINCDDDRIKFRGFIEDQDGDGLAYLRISSDCLLMVESTENDLKGNWIECGVSVNSVEMTPIGGGQ